ncbi:MAG TPA: NAD(P)/FAD-dependent oxidoreductase [Fimbriimonadaceae bacterium]|jgi:flavin-dependent dehydrogenase
MGNDLNCDVAIIGGGPGGSTTAALLRKYAPSLSVHIFEKEAFPRDHVGESQLPGISSILAEMGVWDKVEAADFPIKLGATLLWGRSQELWDFDFIPPEFYSDDVRPGRYEGPRQQTAFHVDRAIYDKILLDHAAVMGAIVHQPRQVKEIRHSDDRVESLLLDDGRSITARYYVDASGNPAILRRALGIETTVPTSLMNVAFWDYWKDAEWAVRIGKHGTRIQVMSVDYGWLWFIPIGNSLTSVGLVVPAYYYKESKKSPEELYRQAIEECPRISSLLENAKPEGRFAATKDWSFVADRATGANWFLVGESAGFADPILSAGMTITQSAARELAYTINEIEKGDLDPKWLKAEFGSRQITRVRNHIRFADYWYSSNAQLKDLKSYTSQIAKDVGLTLDPEEAWRWIALGGFVDTDLNAGTGSFSIEFIKSMGEFLSELEFESPLLSCNTYDLNLTGTVEAARARYESGRVFQTICLERGKRLFPIDGVYGLIHDNLRVNRLLPDILKRLELDTEHLKAKNPRLRGKIIMHFLRGLEALTYDGWVMAGKDPNIPMPDLKTTYKSVHWSH